MKIRSKEELLSLTEKLFADKEISFPSLTQEEIDERCQKDPEFAARISIGKYYSSMQPRPYSTRDFVPKPFHQDLTKLK